MPFRNFLPPAGAQLTDVDFDNIMSRLAMEVLAEVSQQVTSYMRSVGVAPCPTPSVPPPSQFAEAGVESRKFGASSVDYRNQPPTKPDFA